MKLYVLKNHHGRLQSEIISLLLWQYHSRSWNNNNNLKLWKKTLFLLSIWKLTLGQCFFLFFLFLGKLLHSGKKKKKNKTSVEIVEIFILRRKKKERKLPYFDRKKVTSLSSYFRLRIWSPKLGRILIKFDVTIWPVAKFSLFPPVDDCQAPYFTKIGAKKKKKKKPTVIKKNHFQLALPKIT
jgi:hypothetical protein